MGDGTDAGRIHLTGSDCPFSIKVHNHTLVIFEGNSDSARI